MIFHLLLSLFDQIMEKKIAFCLQHDSACRVIARLKKERDEARQLLAEVERHIPAAPEAVTANAPLSNGKRGMILHLFTYNMLSN